jgi:hypothetical protein
MVGKDLTLAEFDFPNPTMRTESMTVELRRRGSANRPFVRRHMIAVGVRNKREAAAGSSIDREIRGRDPQALVEMKHGATSVRSPKLKTARTVFLSPPVLPPLHIEKEIRPWIEGA